MSAGRPTKAHEYIFLLTKSERYFYDAEAVAEPVAISQIGRVRADPVGGASHLERGQHSKGGVYETGRQGTDSATEENAGETVGHQGWLGDQQAGGGFPVLEHGGDEAAVKDKRAKTAILEPQNGQRRMVENNQRARDAGAAHDTPCGDTRNRRSVWTVNTQSYLEAHYATFPEEIPEICIKAGSRPCDLVCDPFGGSGTVGRVAERLGRRWVLLDLGYQDLQKRRLEGVQKELCL